MENSKSLPECFRKRPSKFLPAKKLAQVLKDVPNSVCQEARCPNRGECFNKGILTFLILGTVCTRNCGFCSVKSGNLEPPDRKELNYILTAIEKLALKYVVITSPTRDDLKDGGASHYAYVVQGIKRKYPDLKIEVLIPDFKGSFESLEAVLGSVPHVLNHNLETVASLYNLVRTSADYQRSLEILKQAKQIKQDILTKSGLMIGLGETESELMKTFEDIKDADVDILTIGQYIKPGKNKLDVVKYYHHNEFKNLKIVAEKIGISYVFSGPFVRSSYLADNIFNDFTTREEIGIGV